MLYLYIVTKLQKYIYREYNKIYKGKKALFCNFVTKHDIKTNKHDMKYYMKPTQHPNNTADVFDTQLLDLMAWLDKLIEEYNSKQGNDDI